MSSERQKARKVALQALGMLPPPKKARPGSLNLSKLQSMVLRHIHNKPDDDLVSWAHKHWLSKGTDVLNRMIERDLIRVDALTGKGKATDLGRAAIQLQRVRLQKYGR